MKNILLLFFLFSTGIIIAQGKDIDSAISKELKYLKENKISKFFIIEKDCTGCIKLFKPNEPDCDYGTSNLYVFWKDENECYYRKIDKCNSLSIKITDEIFQNYELKINKIKNESVKAYKTAEDLHVTIDHPLFSRLYFILDGDLIVKQFDNFNLTNESFGPNINYEYNNSLELVKLIKACDKIILKK